MMTRKTAASVFLAVTTLLPVLIVTSTRSALGATPGIVPCNVPPPDLENGEFVGSPEDRIAIYQCKDKFWLEGPSMLTCFTSPNGNDTWVPHREELNEKDHLNMPECHPFKDCQKPNILRGGYDGSCCTPGHQVQFYCDDEHYAVPDVTNATCLPDGTWSEPLPVCEPLKNCQEPVIFRGGYYGECCAPTDEVEFYCDGNRYALSGSANATCLPNGTWSAPMPVCQDTFCRDLGHIPKGQRTMILHRKLHTGECCPQGTAVYHECEEGYQLIGEQTIRCGAGGTWNHARPKCKPEGACDDFPLEYGRVTGERSGGEFFADGDSAFIECDPGFRVDGTDQLFCDNGSWDEEPPTCIEYNCTRFDPGPQLIVDEFEGNNDTSFVPGTSINFRCKHGYVLQGVFSTTCRDGGWFGQVPKCEQIRCGNLRTPLNGLMDDANSTAVGSKRTFACFHGYELMGSRERECLDYGQWSGSPVRCVPRALYHARRRTACMDPGTPDNGARLGPRHFPVGSQVEFVCNPGYHRRGNATIRCLANGNWSAIAPVCLGKYYFDDQRNVEEVLEGKLEQDIRPPVSPVQVNSEIRGRAIYLSAPNIRHFVYFLLDASTSIGERNFRQGVNLAKAITRKVTVSNDGNRIGAIVFAKDAKVEINPMECTSTEQALYKLDNITYLDGSGTSIKAGIEKLNTNLDSVRADLEGAQKNVKFSVFLITDGKANIGGGAETLAGRLRARRPEVYCIGITGSTDYQALEKLASDPVETHFFVLRNFDSLQWLADILTNATTDYGVCGISNKHRRDTGLEDEDGPRFRIIGGERVVRSWPWMVEIRRTKNRDLVICGGSIIGRKWILTAAHCVYSEGEERFLVPSDILVRARPMNKRSEKGTEDEEGTPIELPVEEIVRHENYNSTVSNYTNDIALLRLKTKITYEKHVRPICLPPPKADIPAHPTFYKANASAVVIGWGADKYSKTPRSVKRLKQLVKRMGAPEDCAKHPKYRPEGMICAKSEHGDSCQGDSGGPLMQGAEDGETEWTQVGIVSWGKRCQKNQYAFYTDVSYYVPWIRRHMDDDAAAEAAVRRNDGDNAVVDNAVVQP